MAAVYPKDSSLKEITVKFVENGILADMNIKEGPNAVLKVSYGDLEVNLGTILTPTQTKLAPTVTYMADSNTFYTMVMVDPDVPSRADPVIREMQHWVVANIHGNDFSKSRVLTEYLPPSPHKFTSLHRYVFLLFKQPQVLAFEGDPIVSNQLDDRMKFSTDKFAKKYELGAPIAGNFFEAEWDKSVDPRQ